MGAGLLAITSEKTDGGVDNESENIAFPPGNWLAF
jgi:hypothetical protein